MAAGGLPSHGSAGRPRVVVFDPIPGDWSFDAETQVLARRGVDLTVPSTPAEADELIREADVVVVTGVRRLDAERVASLRKPAGILCYSIGMDKVDASAAAAGIPVRNIPDYCTEEVADHAVTLLLASQRRLVPIANAAAARWRVDRVQLAQVRRLRDQLVGIVGAGRIGRLVGRKARALGFRTVAYDPLVSATDDPELELQPLAAVLADADALVLCAALTPVSRNLVDRETLALVKPGLVLVNVARGGLVDEAALAEALRSGRVAYAALDVRDPEPPDPSTDPLVGLPNVLLTPHVAASSREAADDLHRLAAEAVLELLASAGRIAPAA